MYDLYSEVEKWFKIIFTRLLLKVNRNPQNILFHISREKTQKNHEDMILEIRLKTRNKISMTMNGINIELHTHSHSSSDEVLEKHP